MITLYFALCATFALNVPQCTTQEVKTPYASKKAANLHVVEPVKDYIETFDAEISAYTAIETCGDTCNMKSGKKAYVGAAACPRHIELGTWVLIDGYGTVICEDRTADWTDGKFDIFFGYSEADYQRALQWGVQTRKITINHSL